MNIAQDSERRIRMLANSELSMTSRLGYVALLLLASAMTVIVVTLLTTEPGLPGRARVAFVILSLIGISWIGLATWALTSRRPLAARDRVIAGWMAVAFTSVYLAGTVVVAFMSRDAGGLAAMAGGVLLLTLAVMALRKAKRRFAELAARRAELERELKMGTLPVS